MKPSLNVKIEDHFVGWLESGPGAFSGSTPTKMLLATARSFADHANAGDIVSSDMLNRLEMALDYAGYRGNSVVYRGETRWLLVLPNSGITGVD